MYTGLELAIIGYVLGFVIHIGLFRFFEGFYMFIDNLHFIKPASWCFIWPLAWITFVVKYSYLFVYYIVDYIVSGQWNFNW